MVSITFDQRAALVRLQAREWDFASAETEYLTHNLHPYPAKFIPQIPNALIKELSSPGDTVSDIFCGSGTTLLEALQLNRHALGMDANPLAVLISKAKTTPLTSLELMALADHRGTCAQVLKQAISVKGDTFKSDHWRPESETCQFWFTPHVVEELAELRFLIDGVQNEAAQSLCKVVFSSIIVRVSKQDSDTRYVRRDKAINPSDTARLYINRLDAAIQSVSDMSTNIDHSLSCQVFNADLLKNPPTEPFDLVVSSPPYPNAYSYHLYHRTRMIWLGHDQEQFKEIEIGSHRKYSAKGPRRATPETFRGEFNIIFRWLRNHLRDHRYACFVIGDSTIQGKRIDNASLIAAEGAKLGFLEVARIEREIATTHKSFNPKIGRIKTENILILRKV